MTASKPKRIMIVAGEASGDHHAAGVVQCLKKADLNLQVYGIGGESLRAAGAETLEDSAKMGVVGLFEILKHYPFLKSVLKRLQKMLQQQPPDLLILIDYPEFNLRLAKTAKQVGVPVLYYISPQIWAWRSGRVHEIGRRIDHMAVIFPFELPFYEKAGIPATFVGHPLSDHPPPPQDQQTARHNLGLDGNGPVIGLFPGSRCSEVTRLLSLMSESAQRLRKNNPETRFILPLAPTIPRQAILERIDPDLNIQLVEGQLFDCIRACDAIVTASGTVTLQIAQVGTPLIVVYKVSPLSYFFLKRMVEIEHIALCNIVAEREIVPELIQKEANPALVTKALLKLLEDEGEAQRMRVDLKKVAETLGEPGSAAKVAKIAWKLMGRT